MNSNTNTQIRDAYECGLRDGYARCASGLALCEPAGLAKVVAAVATGSAFADATLSATISNEVRRAADGFIATLEKDLASVTRGEGPEQPRTEAEKTRLLQAIAAMRKMRNIASPPSDLLLGSSPNDKASHAQNETPSEAQSAALARATCSARLELVGSGICDLCGETVDELVAIYAAPVAGLCGCKKCMAGSWPDCELDELRPYGSDETSGLASPNDKTS